MNAAAVLDSAEGLELYLHQAIPLSRAMRVRVIAISDERAVLSAPLEPNINHRGTVFGGSAGTLATLAAWSLLHSRLQRRLPASSLVLQSSSIDYLRPMCSDFRAQAELAPGADWELFQRTLERRGRARIAAIAQLWAVEQAAARFSGEFVALLDVPSRSGADRVIALPRPQL
ncbi:MAG: YiiD C-terminal domain-containing protein [Steroidobacteraceae bacterium]